MSFMLSLTYLNMKKNPYRSVPIAAFTVICLSSCSLSNADSAEDAQILDSKNVKLHKSDEPNLDAGKEEENEKTLKVETSSQLCSTLLSDQYWNRWAISLRANFGEPLNCESEAYPENSPDIISGKIIMTWDNFIYTFEALQPEITIRTIDITSSPDNIENWFDKKKTTIIASGLEIDFENDVDDSEAIEVYASRDESLNAFLTIQRSDQGALESISFTLAL